MCAIERFLEQHRMFSNQTVRIEKSDEYLQAAAELAELRDNYKASQELLAIREEQVGELLEEKADMQARIKSLEQEAGLPLGDWADAPIVVELRAALELAEKALRHAEEAHALSKGFYDLGERIEYILDEVTAALAAIEKAKGDA